MINSIPLLGWIISLLANVSLAVPFWICWSCCDIGIDFFSFLPLIWQTPGFWQCVGLFMVASIIMGLVPRLASVTTNAASPAIRSLL